MLSLLAGLADLLAAAGRAPLVLLDDLDAELDRERLALAAPAVRRQPANRRHEQPAGGLPVGLAPGARWGLAKGLLAGVQRAN